MLLVFSLWCIMMIQDCSTGLWLSPWGWWWIEQVFLFQRITLIVQVKNHFVFICIWIEFPHQPTDCNCTDRVGRQHTELPFFSFMAGWEKEGGQWFQSALVGYLLIPFHWNAGSTIFTYYTFSSLVAKVQEMYPEADGNYMGFKRKGAEENMSWKCSYTWNSAICMKYILVWIPSVGRITELMDSLSSSDDRIGGFPQQVGCWNCQKVDSLSRSEDRIDGFPQQL